MAEWLLKYIAIGRIHFKEIWKKYEEFETRVCGSLKALPYFRSFGDFQCIKCKAIPLLKVLSF